MEAELFVIVRADPFGRIDGAILERRIDVAARHLLRNDPQLGEHFAAEARDAYLDTAEVRRTLYFLAIPAEALAPGVVHCFFSSRRRHTRLQGDWSSDVCSSD